MKKIDFILLVDDDVLCNFLNERIISKIAKQSSIKKLYDGKQALEYFLSIFRENRIDELPELVFLDINMPEMDGFEFLKKFNQINNPRKDSVKIYILTSSDSAIDKEESKKYPISLKYFLYTSSSLLHSKHAPIKSSFFP